MKVSRQTRGKKQKKHHKLTSSILHHRNRHEKESVTLQSEAIVRGAVNSGKKAIKSRFLVAYIFLLNPDYVAAHSLRSFRSNY